MRRITIVVIAGLLLLGGLFAYARRVAIKDWFETRTAPTLPQEETYSQPTAKPQPSKSDAEEPSSSSTQKDAGTSPEDELPAEKNLAVPFIPQAPFQIWDALHEEACEEAAMLMIRGYFDGERGVTPSSTAEERIQELVAFESDLGYGVDVTAEEAAKIIETRWPDLNAEVVPMTGAESVKRSIAEGLPVILPADGKTLPNPNFRNGGPLYHMLVVRGYTEDQFITNDPGTRKGEKFLYTYDGLLDAVRDWNGGDVRNGAQVMIVVRPRG